MRGLWEDELSDERFRLHDHSASRQPKNFLPFGAAWDNVYSSGHPRETSVEQSLSLPQQSSPGGHLWRAVNQRGGRQRVLENGCRLSPKWAHGHWHEDDTQNCSIQLVDGERELFQSAAMTARSQLPDRADFQGWIAFNPAQTLSETDLYRISVHEIGHVLGLQHSANATSVMYFLNLEGLDWLDPQI
jgi:hypothetical protein